jgi:hypothetical protein
MRGGPKDGVVIALAGGWPEGFGFSDVGTESSAYHVTDRFELDARVFEYVGARFAHSATGHASRASCS